MDLFQLLFIGTIPAALIVLCGMLIERTGPEEIARRRYLVYLLAVGALLLLAVFGSVLITPEGNNPFMIAYLLVPSILGVLALILINLRPLAGSGTRVKVLAILLVLVVLALFAISNAWEGLYGWIPLIAGGAILVTLVWSLRKWEGLVTVLSLVSLAMLGFSITAQYYDLRGASRLPLGVIFGFILPSFTVGLAAVLVSNGLKRIVRRVGNDRPESNRLRLLPVLFQFGLAALLVGVLAYTIRWVSIWDMTSDGIGGFFYTMVSSLAAFGAGMVMAATARGWPRLSGAVFAVLVPAILYGSFTIPWDVSYHALTEARAARIQRALESYHARTGGFPPELGELAPRDLLWVPVPVIFQGESWCYEGGQDFYRLGAVYREYFSTPLSIRIYASAGNPPETEWICDRQLAELNAIYSPSLWEDTELISEGGP